MGSGLTQTAWQNRIVIRRKSVDLPTTCKQRRVDRVAAELIQQWSKAHLATIRRYDRAKNTDPRSLSTSTTMIMITGPDRNRRHRIDRLCLVSAVTPSHRRSPMAVGKPSFACFSPAIVTVGCVGPTIQQPNDLLTAIMLIEATSKCESIFKLLRMNVASLSPNVYSSILKTKQVYLALLRLS